MNDKKVQDGNHVAGEYTEYVQRCVICLGTIVDDRGKKYVAIGAHGIDPSPLCGFIPGPVCVDGRHTFVGHSDDLPDCEP